MPPLEEAVVERVHGDDPMVDEPAPARPQPASVTGAQSLPATTSEVRTAYLSHMTAGYMTYGVGAVTAFIAVAFSLSDAQAGLHSSAMASGVILAGFSGERLERRSGGRAIHLAALLVLVLGAIVLIAAPAWPLTLVGAFAIGIGNGLLLAYVNRTLTSGGGTLARVRLARSTLLGMLSALSVSLVIGVAVAVGLVWQLYVVPAAVLIVLAAVAAWSRVDRPLPETHGQARLPRAYWLAWTLVVLVVATEFSIVFWASTVVGQRTGVALEEAVFALTAFVVGIVIGRAALSFHVVSRRDPMALLRSGLAVVIAGTTVAWVSTSFPISAGALMVAGTGLGMLFPLSATTSFALAPGQSHKAAGRIVMGIGLAMLSAPLLLGFVGDLTGIVSAWALVPALCLLALAISVPVRRIARPA